MAISLLVDSMIHSWEMPQAKTSQSHPLRIDPVTIRDCSGVIGLTFCPGKKHSGLYSGAWNRDLGADLHEIKAFGATALVTLMESHELDDVKVPAHKLREQAGQFGLEWHYLPVMDINVPDDQFEDLWVYSGSRLRKILARGGRIVVHCRGGLGRTGTIAGKLLVEFGDQPEDVISEIRKARPGSIETTAQEQYVRNCQPIRFSRLGESKTEEQALACLLGGAIGDAFGYEVEFTSLTRIREKYGPSGIRMPVLCDGKLVVSDDTQMTMFTMEGLLQAARGDLDSRSSYLSSIRNAYLDWLLTQTLAKPTTGTTTFGWLAQQQVMYERRAPGNTCLSALISGGHGTIDTPVNNSKGCGGVMRIAPVALFCLADEPTAVFQLAAEAAALTHGHPSGYLSAGMLAAIIRLLLDGKDLKDAISESSGILRAHKGNEETLRVVNRAIHLAASRSADHAATVEELGAGWVGEEALAIGLYAALSAESFVDAIAIASNHSGDSDSTASIAGQIWGAMNGLDGIPHEWVTSLDVLLPILRLGRQLMASEQYGDSSSSQRSNKALRGKEWPEGYVSIAERFEYQPGSIVFPEPKQKRRKKQKEHVAQQKSEAQSEIVVEVGCEGGSITLFRQRKPGDAWKFRIGTNESALYDLLSEEDLVGIGSAVRESRYVSSFDEALKLLDKYRWSEMLPIEVHPEYFDAVVRAVGERGGHIEAARWLLKFAGSVAVLTGSGVSAESGIPTFRSDGGYWRKYSFQDLATPEAFARDPKLVWTWYEERRRGIATAKPNDGHHALRALEQSKPIFTLITQNVDGLDDLAGSKNIIKLHGDIWTVRCLQCGEERIDRSQLDLLPPYCHCGGMLRPGVVWFGESLPPGALERAEKAVRSADVLIVAGTSAQVYPAAGLISMAKSVIEINPEPTPFSDRATYSVRGTSAETLPLLLRNF